MKQNGLPKIARTLCLSLVVAIFGLIISGLSLGQKPEAKQPSSIAISIPKTWDDEAMKSLQLPLADPRLARLRNLPREHLRFRNLVI